jgi:hypothetical protein
MKHAIAIVLLTLGCHHAQPASTTPAPAPAPAGPATVGDAVDEGIQMLASAAGALGSAQDCPARTAALQAWAKDNQATMTKVRADLHKWPIDDVKAAVKDRMPKHPETDALMDAAFKCKDDVAFGDVWQQISAAME